MKNSQIGLFLEITIAWGRLGGSGHDLRVLGLSPTSGSLLSGEPASLFASPSAYAFSNK